MSRELEAVQAERAGRSHIAPISLVKITTYTDRVAEVIAKVFYFSTLPVTYDYGATGTDQRFLPVVLGGGDFLSQVGHVPQPDDLNAYAQSFDLRLSNYPINGDRLINTMQGYNLEGARIEVAQLLVDRIDSLPIDLTAYDGDEHTVLMRGRVMRVSPITDSFFTMQCGPDLPNMAGKWLYATDTTQVAPQDVGKRLPHIYGAAKRVPLVSWNIGHVGVLLDRIINATENNVNKAVTDASAFPASFTIIIDSEKIACTKIDNNTIKINSSGRAQDGTTGAEHEIGTPFLEEIATTTWIANDSESYAVGNVYTINPTTGQLARIQELQTPLTKNVADATLISGKTVTSVSIVTEGSTVQQPYSCTDAVGSPTSGERSGAIDRVGVGYGAAASYVYYSSGNDANFNFQDLGTFTSQTVRVTLVGQYGDVLVKVNGVTIGTITSASIGATTPTEFSFTTAQVANLVLLDTSGGGGMVVCNVERTINLVTQTQKQIPISGTTNTAGTIANLYDGDQDTGVALASTNDYVQLTFADPGYAYDAQRIRLLIDWASGAARWSLKVGTTVIQQCTSGFPDGGKIWYEWETDETGESITLTQTEANALGTVYEVERTVINTITAQQSPLSINFYADIDGCLAPDATVLSWALAHSFDSGTWEADDCAVAADSSDKAEGTASQKITITEPSECFGTEATTNWTGSNATVSVINSEGHLAGSYCVKAVSTSGSAAALLAFSDAGSAVDLSDTGSGKGILAFDMKTKYGDAPTEQVGPIYFGTDATNSFRSYQGSSPGNFPFHFPIAVLPEDTWVTVYLDYEQAATSGSPDETSVQYFAINFNNPSGVGPFNTGVELYIDNIRVIRDRAVVIQNNGLSGANFTGASQDYRLAAKLDGQAVLAQAALEVFISDDTGTGTTLTTDYRQITYPAPDSSWGNLEETDVTDVNTIDIAAIDTLRVELTYPAFPPDEVPAQGGATLLRAGSSASYSYLWVDDLEVSATVSGAYQVVAGRLIEHPADCLRHWIEIVGGEAIDETSYAALVTALGASAKFAFDARVAGFAWEEVLQRMAFEARCNVVPVETSSGRVWKMLSADTSYGFGAPSGSAVITQTHAITDVGRGLDDLASYYTFRYAFDPTLPGNGNEEGFAKVILANPDVSAVPIAVTDIEAAAKRFGNIDSGPIAFVCIQDDDTAEDVAGYLVQERMDNRRRVFELRDVAWFDALPYDVGDIVSITPPWSSSPVTARLISMSKAFESNAWRLVAVEVLEEGLHT